MRNASTSRYSLTRRTAIRDRKDELPVARRALGSQPPPPADHRDEDGLPVVDVVRLGAHQLEVVREGAQVSLRLPGALHLRGNRAEVRALAAALLDALDA